jgi:peptidoglycan-associated lipoprotein
MRNMMRNTALLTAIAALVVVTSGCGKKKEVAQPAPPPVAEQPAPAPAPPPAEPAAPTETAAEAVQKQLQDVFYDFDSSALSSAAKATLDANGKVLMDNASVGITIEGHCDERGTVEYNLALGDRRASSARDYLVRYGVPASRIQTVSYGEERPFATGSTEEAWAQNRRAHFVAR